MCIEQRKYRVLIVDDEPGYPTKIYQNSVKDDYNFDPDPEICRKPEDLSEKTLENIDIILLDFQFDNSQYNGHYALQKIQAFKKNNEHIKAKIILLSSMREYAKWDENAKLENLLNVGVNDFIVKGVAEEFCQIFKFQLDRALNDIDKGETLDALKTVVSSYYKITRPNFIGESDKMAQVFKKIGRVAPTSETVLITGANGTGKELVAKEIHHKSDRCNGPFVAVNCPAIAPSLFESELFGHEKGAFTGAINRKIGYFEKANKGTIFLDEIAEIDLGLQAKLLRVLEEREMERVGGTKPIKVDVRVIAATNKELSSAIEQGGFREDLFQRLSPYDISIPTLKERLKDIKPLVEHFLYGFRKKNPPLGNLEGISDAAIDKLMQYHWPGNVRELKNIMTKCAIDAKGPEILPDDIHFNKTLSAKEESPISTGKDLSFDAKVVVDELIEDRDRAYEEFIRKYGQDKFNELQEKPEKEVWEKYIKLRKLKIEGRQRSPIQKVMIAEEMEKILSNKGKGVTEKTVAIAMGMSYGTLRQLLAKHGVSFKKNKRSKL